MHSLLNIDARNSMYRTLCSCCSTFTKHTSKAISAMTHHNFHVENVLLKTWKNQEVSLQPSPGAPQRTILVIKTAAYHVAWRPLRVKCVTR